LAYSISKTGNRYNTVLTVSTQLHLACGHDAKTFSWISVLHIELSLVLKSQSYMFWRECGSTFVHLWLDSRCPISGIDVGFTGSAWWAFECWIPSEVDHSLDTGHGISRLDTYPLMVGKA